MGRSFLITRGFLGIAGGIVAMAWPAITLVVLVAVFGLYAMLDGLTNLLHGLMHDDALGASSPTALQGAIGIIVGVLVSVWPSMTTVLLVTFMGSWAAASGVLEIEEGIRFRYEIIDEWLLALNGFLSLLFALAVFAFPGSRAITLAWMLGLYVAATGVVLIMRGLRLRTTTVA